MHKSNCRRAGDDRSLPTYGCARQAPTLQYQGIEGRESWAPSSTRRSLRGDCEADGLPRWRCWSVRRPRSEPFPRFHRRPTGSQNSSGGALASHELALIIVASVVGTAVQDESRGRKRGEELRRSAKADPLEARRIFGTFIFTTRRPCWEWAVSRPAGNRPERRFWR